MRKITTDRIARSIEDIGDDWCIVGHKSHRYGTWSYEFNYPGAWGQLQDAIKRGWIVSIQDSASFPGESVLYAKRVRPTFSNVRDIELVLRTGPSKTALPWS